MHAHGQSRRAATFADPPATEISIQPKENTSRVLLMAPSMDSEESPLTSRLAGYASAIHYMEYPDELIQTDELSTTASSRDAEEPMDLEG